MIIVSISAVAGLVLLVITTRTWLEFSRREEQLSTTIADCRRRIEEHTAKLAQIRDRSKAVQTETETAVEECNELDRSVVAEQEELQQLDERLERVRPSHRRVDTGRERGDAPWRRA